MFDMELKFFNQDMNFPFFIQYGYHSGDFFRHIHKDFTELVIVMEGTTSHLVGKDTHLVKKGDVFVVGSNTEHEYKDSRNFQLCNIMFKPDFFFSNTFHIKESVGFHALFYIEPYLTKEYVFKSRLKLQEEEYRLVYSLLEKMMAEYKQKQEGWKEMIHSTFIELVVYLSRNYDMPKDTKEQSIIQVANAASFIEKNYKFPITLKEIADTACLSERHFTRIFKETYQFTPMQYVIRLRLIYGAELLKNTCQTVTEIALLCGFPDNNYFARKFKNLYQLSPSEYRYKYLNKDF